MFFFCLKCLMYNSHFFGFTNIRNKNIGLPKGRLVEFYARLIYRGRKVTKKSCWCYVNNSGRLHLFITICKLIHQQHSHTKTKGGQLADPFHTSPHPLFFGTHKTATTKSLGQAQLVRGWQPHRHSSHVSPSRFTPTRPHPHIHSRTTRI